jgi:hypothetical protein
VKISEVIAHLEAALRAHGDLPVYVPDREDEHEADEIKVRPEDKPLYPAQFIPPARVCIW